MQSKFIGLFFIVEMLFSPLSYAKDFFRVSGGELLISDIGMTQSAVMDIINNEKSPQRIGYNHYILEASVGGEFDVRLRYTGDQLTEIVAKQLGRKDYR